MTLNEMKEKGYFEYKGRCFVERYYVNRCKKILGIKVKYKTRHFKLIEFLGQSDDGGFRFHVMLDSNSFFNPCRGCNSSYFCGQLVELDIIPYQEKIFKKFKFIKEK